MGYFLFLYLFSPTSWRRRKLGRIYFNGFSLPLFDRLVFRMSVCWKVNYLTQLFLLKSTFRLGRRKLLLPAAFISLAFLTTYVICAVLQPKIPLLKYGCIGSLGLYTIIYGFGVGPICWFLVSELVPQKMRSRVQVSIFCKEKYFTWPKNLFDLAKFAPKSDKFHLIFIKLVEKFRQR